LGSSRTQHRAKRETNTRENQELRKEIDSLQRTVARLRKENDKLRQLSDEPSEEEILAEPESFEAKCPKCKQASLGSISTPGGKVVTICTNCKKYRKVESCS